MKRYTISKLFRFDEKCNAILKGNIEKRNIAAKKKITESEYIRNLIIQDNFEQATFNIDKKTYSDMVRILAGLGNNINQIAHKMNMDIYDKDDIEEVKRASNEIEKLRNKLDQLYIAIKNGG